MKHLLLLFVVSGAFAQQVAYPLHLGDSWQYRVFEVPPVDTFVYAYKALSDTIFEGKRYTVVRFLGSSGEEYQRQSGDSVLIFYPWLKREVVRFDFSRFPGDTVSVTPWGPDTMDVVLRFTSVRSYFGKARRTWTFYVNLMRHSIDDEYSITVADSLGIVEKIPDFGPRLYLAGAVIDGRIFGTIVGVGRSQDQFRTLLQTRNFPNPFNAATTISFSLPQSSEVTIEIINVTGERVTEAHLPSMPAGKHSIYWDASRMPSGAYLYRLRTTTGTVTGRMMLVR